MQRTVAAAVQKTSTADAATATPTAPAAPAAASAAPVATAVLTTAKPGRHVDLVTALLWLAVADGLLCVGAWLGACIEPAFGAAVEMGRRLPTAVSPRFATLLVQVNCLAMGVVLSWRFWSFVHGWSNAKARLAAWATISVWAGTSCLLVWLARSYPGNAVLGLTLLAVGFLWHHLGGEQGRYRIARSFDRSRLRD